MSKYKFSEHDVVEEYKRQSSYHAPPINRNKVLAFQRHTDDIEQLVEWVINSMENDREQAKRRLGHDTGCYVERGVYV